MNIFVAQLPGDSWIGLFEAKPDVDDIRLVLRIDCQIALRSTDPMTHAEQCARYQGLEDKAALARISEYHVSQNIPLVSFGDRIPV